MVWSDSLSFGEPTWLLHRYPNTVLIPGTTTIEHLEANLAAASIELTADEIEQLDRIQSI